MHDQAAAAYVTADSIGTPLHPLKEILSMDFCMFMFIRICMSCLQQAALTLRLLLCRAQ